MQLGRESWRSDTRQPRRALGKRQGCEPNPACISQAELHRRGAVGWRERRKRLLYLGMPACLLDASMGKEERMALFLNNWPVRWQSRYYGNVNLITERDIFWKSLAVAWPHEYLRVSQCVPPFCAPPGLPHFKYNLFPCMGWHISPIAAVDLEWWDALWK